MIYPLFVLRRYLCWGLVLQMTWAASMAWANTTLYGINNSASPNGSIMEIDSTTSNGTVIWSGLPFPFSSTNTPEALAQCPNGLLYFLSGGDNGTLYRFNPATPTIAPVAIGSTGISAPGFIKASCHPTTGVLYAMGIRNDTLYVINTVTGAADSPIGLTPPTTTPPDNTGGGTNGDIGFNSFGKLYLVSGTNPGAANVRLWIINLATNAIENVGAITGLPDIATGLAFDQTDSLQLSLKNQTQLYTAPITGGAATPIGAAGAMPELFDLSSIMVGGFPSILVVKTSIVYSDPLNNTTDPKRIPGGFVDFINTVTNSGLGATDNDSVLIRDPVPDNTTLFVGDLGLAGSGPVVFTDGTTSSGLTYIFSSLDSTTDDVTFFTDAACTLPGGGITPVPDSNGIDSNIRCIRINPKGVFWGDGDQVSPSPNFAVRFRVRIE